MAEWNPRANELFLHAFQLKSAGERQAYLDEACASDTALRQAVEMLLKAHDQAGSFLHAPYPAVSDPEGRQPTSIYQGQDATGAIIAGKYKLLQQIGEGGMGSVWMADQTEPVKRRVAVKLIRTERGKSKTILARFEAERQAIALMDHPNIAKLLDAGETPSTHVGGSAQPYFVMELVKGVPLTEFCDTHKLNIPDRLGLFMQICSAIQHAHQKGIIHRDLKPTNILVELHDDKPVPKVIDFGLAKATSGIQLTENTLFTGFGTVAGTPLYMAPEQANFNAVDIDTRTDIYALGVILYELLTGTTPISRETMKTAALDEMMKLIREQEAPTPSIRLSSSRTMPAIAANRHTEPQKLGRYVKGELDWIVMKALSKERDRRYETANGFAKDIERFLNREAIQAGPVSASYRFRKFVSRNRSQVAAVSLIVLTLLGGFIVSSYGFYLADLQRQQREGAERSAIAGWLRAEENAAEAKKQEKLAREQEAATRAINQFLQHGLLGQADSSQQVTSRFVPNPNLTMKEALDRAASRIHGAFPGQELIEAELRYTIGYTYIELGESRKAIPHLERCRDLRIAKLGVADALTILTLNNLGRAYLRADRTEDARQLYATLVPHAESTLGHDHEVTIACKVHLASSYQENRLQEAISLLEEELRHARAVLGAENETTLVAINNLAHFYTQADRMRDALPLNEEVLASRRQLFGDEHPETQTSINNLGSCYSRLGMLSKAIPLYEEAYRLRKQTMNENHPLTIRCQANLGISYREVGRVKEALPLLEEAVRRGKALKGTEGINLSAMLGHLGECYSSIGDHAKAEPLFREMIEITKQIRPAKPTVAAGWQARLGLNLMKQGRYADAETVTREALASRMKFEPDDWRTFNTQSILGGCLLGLKKYAEAEPLLLTGHDGMKKRLTTIPELGGKERYAESLERLVQIYQATGKPDESARWRKELEASQSQRLPFKSPLIQIQTTQQR